MIHKLKSLFQRHRLDAEMSEEMRHHVELQIALNLKAGMKPDDARYAALRQFGNVASIQEQAREQRGWFWLENLVRDAGFAVRTLRKSPGFTSVVVLTLGLGLGVNTALFTWFNAAAFRPLPVPDAKQLYRLVRLDAKGKETTAMSYVDFVAYRDHQTVFSGLTAFAYSSVQLLDLDDASASARAPLGGFRVETVSTNYFAVFGVPTALGRPLVAADESSSHAAPVIVLSHRFWQNYLGGNPAVIGRTINLGGLAQQALTIVGVAGPEFHGTSPLAPVGWAPLLMRRGDAWRTDLQATGYELTGRLRPGLAHEQAAEELQVIAREFLARPRAGADRSEKIILAGASSYLNFSARDLVVMLPLTALFGAVFLVSCANASNLILARTVTRQFEFAVRGAFGATRPRLLSLLLTESVVLGVLGGLVGWAVSAGLLKFAWPWLLDMVPGAHEIFAGLLLQADYRVFVFTLGVSLLAGVAGGLWPALHVTRRNIDSALKRAGSAFGRGWSLSRVRNFLAVGQLALSSALVFTAGLLAHRALSVHFASVGFDKSTILMFELLAPRTHDAAQLDAARRQALARVRAVPEVVAVSELFEFPFAPRHTNVSIPADDGTGGRAIGVIHTAVPSDHFTTLQLPVIRGRAFAADEIASDHVAVISETAARVFWPHGEALGRRFEVPTSTLPGHGAAAAVPATGPDVPRTSVTVIGIVRDTRMYDPRSYGRPIIYLPLAPQTAAAPYLLIRLSQSADRLPPALRQAGFGVTGIAPRLVPLDELFNTVNYQNRVVAVMAGILAVISLFVAVIGLYGVMSFNVTQRVKEIGIRIALGATPRRVVSGIVLECLRLVGVGAAVGYALSVGIARVAHTLVLGVSAFDPLACGVVALLLAGLGLIACWIPARRAAKVDPMVVLRAE